MILKHFFGLGVDKSFLRTASRDEGRGIFVAERQRFTSERNASSVGAVHQRSDTLLESANVIANSFG